MMMWGLIGMGVAVLFGLLVLAAVVLLVVLLVRLLSQGRWDGASGTSGSTARAVLDERYARGELSSEEYQERLRLLGSER